MALVPGLIGRYPLSKLDSDLDTHVWPLLKSKGATVFGAVGFCAGTAPVLHLSHSKLHAGAHMHPSHSFLAPLYGTTTTALVEAVKCPQLMYTAGGDNADQKPGGAEEKILRGKAFGEKCEFREFPEMKHGWVSRGEITTPADARDYEEAMDGMIKFFHANLLGNPHHKRHHHHRHGHHAGGAPTAAAPSS